MHVEPFAFYVNGWHAYSRSRKKTAGMQVENRGKKLMGATSGAAAHPIPNVASPFFGLIVPHLPVVTNFRKAGTCPDHCFTY